MSIFTGSHKSIPREREREGVVSQDQKIAQTLEEFWILYDLHVSPINTIKRMVDLIL